MIRFPRKYEEWFLDEKYKYDMDHKYDWWQIEEKAPLIKKEAKVLPFFKEVYEIDEWKLMLHRKLPKRNTQKKEDFEWLGAERFLADDTFAFMGQIFLNEQVIGTIDGFRHKDETSYLETIVIDEYYRQKQIATTILKFLIEKSKSRGSKTFVIEQVIDDREGMQYKNNLLIFKRILQRCIRDGIIIRYTTLPSEKHPLRTDMIVTL